MELRSAVRALPLAEFEATPPPDKVTTPPQGFPDLVPGGASTPGGTAPSDRVDPPWVRPASVLWVDDTPESQALTIDGLRRRSVSVDLAASTDEALQLVRDHSYGAVVTTMTRREGQVAVPDAGLRLLDAVRRTDPLMPVVIHGSGELADRAMVHGAAAVTGSTVEILETLRSRGVLPT